MRQYKNFNEIERDKRLLKLQMEIDKEKMILSYNYTKESLAPVNLIKNMAGTVFKSAVILKGANKVLGMIGGKKDEK
ncbi:hypothetical protein GCM10007103_20270 [Salinimicrobium marinum]|uniref:Uncharacterized protein n=1 Tax=Salinimicrobium marinum TaxID=680283 RepID=A0A918SHJ2_9FLAO|nr:DUF6327 family protein [Salinimicrobium marinum]GHA38833.1 hypothetical protein GCM10007103_20270 [Salinimicrobium marinum]